MGSNQLRWLPWELLELIKDSTLEKCRIYPNPLIRPVPSIWNHQTRHRTFESDEPLLVASTQIAFLDITGATHRGWPPAPSSTLEHWVESTMNENAHRPAPKERTKTPSLLEVALRACYKSIQLSQLPFLLPEYSKRCPDHLSQLLQMTWSIKEAGGPCYCSVCGGSYIVPRTEWVEWWYCLPSEGPQARRSKIPTNDQGPIPFLRRGCSWQCWEESEDPLIRGWNSTPMPGGREYPKEVAANARQSAQASTIPYLLS